MIKQLKTGTEAQADVPLGTFFSDKEAVTQVIITMRRKGNYIRANGERVKAEIYLTQGTTDVIHAIADDRLDVVVKKLQDYLEKLP